MYMKRAAPVADLVEHADEVVLLAHDPADHVLLRQIPRYAQPRLLLHLRNHPNGMSNKLKPTEP